MIFIGRHDVAQQILEVSWPQKMRSLGQLQGQQTDTDLYEGWLTVRQVVMMEIIFKWMEQDGKFHDAPISTGDAKLIEDVASSQYWGCGHDDTG